MDETEQDLPEVLEFLKLSRTTIRQLQLFKETETSSENQIIVKKAAEKMKRTLDSYLEGE